jgi:hypothetical protein
LAHLHTDYKHAHTLFSSVLGIYIMQLGLNHKLKDKSLNKWTLKQHTLSTLTHKD